MATKRTSSTAVAVCSRCRLELPHDAFPWRDSGRRRNSQCKKCVYEKVKEWRAANPEKYKALDARKRERVRNDPVRRARERELENARRRSKTKRGQMFTSMCKRCEQSFEYEFIQRHRELCDLCRQYPHEWTNFRLTGPEAHALRSRSACDICGRTHNPGGRFNKWHIDHCHDTGKVRGLLCAPCNTVLGLMGNDPERLRAAADYIQKE